MAVNWTGSGQDQPDEADRVRRGGGVDGSGLRHLSRGRGASGISEWEAISCAFIPKGHPAAGDVADGIHALARLAERIGGQRLHDRGRRGVSGDGLGGPDGLGGLPNAVQDDEPDRPGAVCQTVGQEDVQSEAAVLGRNGGFQAPGQGGV